MFHTFTIGAINATILSDGPIRVDGTTTWFQTPDPAAMDAALQTAGAPTDRIVMQQNCLLIETGGKRALFDNGMGSSKLYGPDSGQLLTSLSEAGIDPAAIDAVVLTHGHSDHCWGTMRDDGKPTFPNAQLYLSEAELAYWEADPPLERHTPSLDGARRNLLPLRDRMHLLRDGEEFLAGVQAWLTPGHTPGHLAYLFDGGWCLAGDIAFHEILSYAFPEARSRFDTDRGLAVQTRKTALGRLADERLRIIGYHQPWPGLGRVERAGNAFRFVPS